MDTRVMGIDPSTTRTGWAVIEMKDGATDLIACGSLPAHRRGWQRLAMEERCLIIAREIGAVVAAREPGWVYQERTVVTRFPGDRVNRKTSLVLAHLGGAIAQEVAAARDGLRSSLLAPAEWRRLLGVRRTGKVHGLAYVHGWCSLHGIPLSSYSEDELEAIGIALAGLEELKRGGIDEGI